MKTIKFVLISAVVFTFIGLTYAGVLAQDALTLKYGQPVAGTLAAGQSLTYTFTGAAGDKLSVNMATTGGELEPMISLYDPQGQLIGENANAQKYTASLEGIVLSKAGSYRLVIRNVAPQGSGQYGLIVLQETATGAIYYDAKPSDREAYQLSEPLDHTDLTYRLVNTQPGFDPGLVRRIITQAFQSWANVTNLTFKEVGSGRSDFVIQFGRIDGGSKILGEACPPSSPCAGEIKFDADEDWTMEQLQSQREISFLGVATHEFGHAIGLLHSNNPNALMYYAYSPYNLKPAADDIAGVQRLYGRSTGRTANSPTSIPGLPQDPVHPTVQGTIDNRQFTQFWDFGVEAGDTVTITMRKSSGNLDGVLVLLDANNKILAYDDDSGGNRDAALRNVRLPQRGTYTVAATRYEQAQGFTAGNYTLTINYNDQPVATQAQLPPTPFGQGGPIGNGSVQISKGQPDALNQLPSLDTTVNQPFAQGNTPSTQTQAATVSRSQSYVWALTWCAADTATLQNNIRNISVAFAVNGRAADAGLVTQTAPHTVNGLSCVDYMVTLSGWSGSTVSLTRTLTFRSNLFDGSLVYAAGNYIDQYTVTVQ